MKTQNFENYRLEEVQNERGKRKKEQTSDDVCPQRFSLKRTALRQKPLARSPYAVSKPERIRNIKANNDQKVVSKTLSVFIRSLHVQANGGKSRTPESSATTSRSLSPRAAMELN